MNKKGFTLIELLAVIIILSLLAVLASTSVTKIVKDSKSDLYDTQINLIKAAAEAWGADHLYELPDAGTCKYITLFDLKQYGLIDPEIKNPKTGEVFDNNLKIKISGKQTTYGNTNVIYEVNPNDIEGCIQTYPCRISTDNNENNIADFGDVITCSSESFYVMDNDGTDITMLAMYNLDVGSIQYTEPWELKEIENPTGLQSENALGYKTNLTESYGVIAFSTNNYWVNCDASSCVYLIDSNYMSEGRSYPFIYGDYKDVEGNQQNLIYPYVQSYKEKLQEMNVNVKEARLISYEEAYNIQTNKGDPNWLYNTTYWTGSAAGEIIISINPSGLTEDWDAGRGYYNTPDTCGVRPVIVIPANMFN